MKENADRARSLDKAELAKELRESAEQMFRLRFQLSMGQSDGLKKLRQLRRERARMLTVERERELHIEEPHHAAAVAPPAPKKAAHKVKPVHHAKPAAKVAVKKKTKKVAKHEAKKAAKKEARKEARPKAKAKAKAHAKPKASPVHKTAAKTAAKKPAGKKSAKG